MGHWAPAFRLGCRARLSLRRAHELCHCLGKVSVQFVEREGSGRLMEGKVKFGCLNVLKVVPKLIQRHLMIQQWIIDRHSKITGRGMLLLWMRELSPQNLIQFV